MEEIYTNEIRGEQLLEDKEMRQSLLSRMEVLDKVKEMITLPNTELLTAKLVSEYYEVSQDVIRDNVRRHKEELESNGMIFKKYGDIKEILRSEGVDLRSEMSSRLGINRVGTNIFSVRAALNIGMLLRDSIIAREIRNQLLNGYENLSEEQKVKEIVSERDLLYAIIDTADDPIKQMMAVGELNNYHNRHKAELNVRIDEMKPKEEAFDTFISTEGYQKMNDVAKSVGYGRNKLYKFLREKKVLMKDNQPYQSYIDRGWFTVKQNTIVQGSFTKNHAQTYASPKRH